MIQTPASATRGQSTSTWTAVPFLVIGAIASFVIVIAGINKDYGVAIACFGVVCGMGIAMLYRIARR